MNIKLKFIILVTVALLGTFGTVFNVVFSEFEKDKLAYLYDIELLDMKQVEMEIFKFEKKSVSSLQTLMVQEVVERKNSTRVLYHIFNKRIESIEGYDSELVFKVKDILNMGGSVGVQRIDLKNNSFVLGYLRITENDYVIKIRSFDEVFENVENLKIRSLYVTLIILSVFLLLSVALAAPVTNGLGELEKAVIEMDKTKKYTPVIIDSNDEVGNLSKSFNSMAKQLFELLEEVNSYNTQLESIVKAKTASLNKSLRIQRAMMSVVSQGFFMIDPNRIVSGDCSAATLEIVGNEIKGKDFIALLKYEETEDVLRRLFDTAFLEKIPFSSIVELLPAEVKSYNGKDVVIEYKPIRNRSGKIIALVIVLTDVTETKRLEDIARNEKAESKQIIKLSRERKQFVSLLNFIEENIAEFSHQEYFSEEDIENYARFLHSLKGLVGLFYMEDFAVLIHKLESELEKYERKEFSEYVKNCFSEIEKKLDEIMSVKGPIVDMTDWRNAKNLLKFETNYIENLLLYLKNHIDKEILSEVERELLFVRLDGLLTGIEDEIVEHAKSVGKEIREVLIEVSDVRIAPGVTTKLTSIFNHLLKNAVDHGLEEPVVRMNRKKKAGGRIEIRAKNTSAGITINISDDGAGINLDKIRARAIKNKVELSKLSDNQIIDLIFENNFSTAETVTISSGRGVGMGAVREMVTDLGGMIEIIRQEKNMGTCFSLRFPVGSVCTSGTFPS